MTTEAKKKFPESETVTLKRSQINFHERNPKIHSKESIQKMVKNFKKVGYLGGIIWNERTGKLIDGHQRTMAMDIINKYDGTPETDYQIKVERVDFDTKTELEQNIFQTRSRTELDDELMRDLIPEIDATLAGLDDYDLSYYGVDTNPQTADDVISAIDDLYALVQQQKEIEKEIKKEKSAEEKKAAVQETKQQIREAAAEKAQNLDAYITLSFETYKSKAVFMNRLGFDPDAKYIKGETLAEMVEVI